MKNNSVERKMSDVAVRNPDFGFLCTLPDGRIIRTGEAEAQGFVVRAKGEAGDAPEASPRPLPASLATVPPRPVAPPVPAAVVADRARAAAITEATPPGAEPERDEAIRTGASVEEFRQSLGAFTILSAMRAARGR